LPRCSLPAPRCARSGSTTRVPANIDGFRRVPGVTVAVHDTPENILERITFYDVDS
jgi:hypothetical protein